MDNLKNMLALSSLGQQINTITNPLGLVNHILQAWFFSIAICNLVAFALETVHFAYAQEVATSRLTQYVGLGLFFYLKIWDYYKGPVYFVSVFALTMVALYVYDCCGNISQRLDSWKQQHRDLAIILSFLSMFSTTLYIIWQIYKNNETPLKYQYSGIYVLIIILVVMGNFLRKRSILYALFGVLTINYLIAARHLLHNTPDHTSHYIESMKIPLQTLVYFMMALDAQKREREAIGKQTYKSIFKTCLALAAFSILNDTEFPLELLLGGIFIFGLITNK